MAADRLALPTPGFKPGNFWLIIGLICGTFQFSTLSLSPVFALQKLSAGKRGKLSLKNSERYLQENADNERNNNHPKFNNEENEEIPDNEENPNLRIRSNPDTNTNDGQNHGSGELVPGGYFGGLFRQDDQGGDRYHGMMTEYSGGENNGEDNVANGDSYHGMDGLVAMEESCGGENNANVNERSCCGNCVLKVLSVLFQTTCLGRFVGSLMILPVV
jgi:hypothetical protein